MRSHPKALSTFSPSARKCRLLPRQTRRVAPPPRGETEGPDQNQLSARPPTRSGKTPPNAWLAELPPEVLPYKPLLLAKTITLTLDLGKEAQLTARLDYADEAGARDGETALRTSLYVARENVAARLPVGREATCRRLCSSS